MKFQHRTLLLLLLPVLFINLFPSDTRAQDTTQPMLMSKAAYDSTLRVLKKARAAKSDSVLVAKRSDSLNKAAEVLHEDSLKAAADSGHTKVKIARRHRADTAKRKRKERFGYVALNFGTGIPLSGYEATGSAANGSNYSLCAAFPGIHSYYCWTFKFDYGVNGINTAQYLHDVSEYVYPAYQYNMNEPVPSYSYYSIMTGVSRIIPMGRLAIDVRILFGFLHGTAPQTSYNVMDSGKTLTVTQYKCAAWAFAFGFGLDLRYRINSGFSLLLNYDYLTSHPSMQLVSSGFQSNPFSATAPALSTYTQAFVLNNLTIGLGYALSGK